MLEVKLDLESLPNRPQSRPASVLTNGNIRKAIGVYLQPQYQVMWAWTPEEGVKDYGVFKIMM